MRNFLAIAAAVIWLGAGATARAFDPAPEGSRLEVTFTAVLEGSKRADPAKGMYTSASSKHVLNGSCLVEAAPPQAYGFEGPPDDAPQAKAPDAMLDLEREYKKCGNDQACLRRLAEKAAGLDLAPEEPPAEWQIWHPQRCSGALSVDDSSYTDDPGGEGGGGAYKETVTVKGAGSWPQPGERDIKVIYLETNFVKGTTTVRFAPPPSAIGAVRSVARSGDGARSESKPVKASFSTTLLGQTFGPYPGPSQAGSEVKKTDSGTLRLEWGVAKKPR